MRNKLNFCLFSCLRLVEEKCNSCHFINPLGGIFAVRLSEQNICFDLCLLHCIFSPLHFLASLVVADADHFWTFLRFSSRLPLTKHNCVFLMLQKVNRSHEECQRSFLYFLRKFSARFMWQIELFIDVY